MQVIRHAQNERLRLGLAMEPAKPQPPCSDEAVALDRIERLLNQTHALLIDTHERLAALEQQASATAKQLAVVELTLESLNRMVEALPKAGSSSYPFPPAPSLQGISKGMAEALEQQRQRIDPRLLDKLLFGTPPATIPASALKR